MPEPADHRGPLQRGLQRIANARAAKPPTDHNGHPIGPPAELHYDEAGRYLGDSNPQRAALDYLAALTADEFDALAREARATPTTQLTRGDLAGMTPEAIVQAQAAGRLDTLLGVPQQQQDLIARAAALAPITRADLAELNRQGRHDLAAAYAPHLDRVTD